MKMNIGLIAKHRITAIVGLVSITVNTIMLKTARLWHINAEAGGLLKLCLKLLPAELSQAAFFHSTTFWILFHYLTGGGLVMIYIIFVKKKLKWPGWINGTVFALFLWLINSLVVLPLLGQHIFGVKQLRPSGIIYFFVGNLIFGLLLGGLDNIARSYMKTIGKNERRSNAIAE